MQLQTIASSVGLFMAVLACTVTANQEFVRTDRYTLAALEVQSDQKSPLTTITHISLGRDITSVGGAIHELLKGSGYRWQGSEDQMLNDLPLPDVVRNMGPIRLEDALSTLAGNAWTLKVDDMHRVIWFEVDAQAVQKRDIVN